MSFWKRVGRFFSRTPLIIAFLILLTALFTYIFWGDKTFVLMASTLAIMLYLGWRRSREPKLDLMFAEGEEVCLEPAFYDLKRLEEFATQTAKRLHEPRSRGGFNPISAVSRPSSDKMQEYCVEWILYVAKMQSIMELEFELINNSSVTAEDIEVIIELPNQWKAGEKLPDMPDRPKTIPAGISVAPTIVGQLSKIEQRLSGSRQIDPEIEQEENKVYFYLPHLNPHKQRILSLMVSVSEQSPVQLPFEISYSKVVEGKLEVKVDPTYRKNYQELAEKYIEEEMEN